MESKTPDVDRRVVPNEELEHAPHLVQRGKDAISSEMSQGITGYDSQLMSGRSLLSSAEEKRLLRRVDLRLMPLLALILMIKNLDANNVGLPVPPTDEISF